MAQTYRRFTLVLCDLDHEKIWTKSYPLETPIHEVTADWVALALKGFVVEIECKLESIG